MNSKHVIKLAKKYPEKQLESQYETLARWLDSEMMVAHSSNTGIGQARAKKCSELPCVAPQLRERGFNT